MKRRKRRAGSALGAARAGRVRKTARPWWAELPDEELLELRLGELGLTIEDSALEPRLERLREELLRKGLRFRPHVWLSVDWFAPDGVPGFAVPFYLAHPRLARLERRATGDVEGGTRVACMKLLRHETGHAIDNAYRLRRRVRFREVFGSIARPYRATYAVLPASRAYVQHLDHWYAQSHPSEDFAETFAVWLQPGSRWRSRYAGWPALQKLEYVDQLMAEVCDLPPSVRRRERTDSLPKLRTTIGEHSERRRKELAAEAGDALLDRPLRRLFPESARAMGRGTAAGYLRRARPELRRRACVLSGQPPYVVDQVLTELIDRCRELDLRLGLPERRIQQTAVRTLAEVTTAVMRDGQRRFRR